MYVLVVMDYQNDFVMGSLEGRDAESIENRICDHVSEYLEWRDRVIFTIDIHGSDYLSTHERKLLPVEHCIRRTRDWEFHGRLFELSRWEEYVVVRKGTFGCPNLTDLLKGCDVVTNICVIANTVIARTARLEARVFAHRGCVASYDRVLGVKALNVMESLPVEIE